MDGRLVAMAFLFDLADRTVLVGSRSSCCNDVCSLKGSGVSLLLSISSLTQRSNFERKGSIDATSMHFSNADSWASDSTSVAVVCRWIWPILRRGKEERSSSSLLEAI